MAKRSVVPSAISQSIPFDIRRLVKSLRKRYSERFLFALTMQDSTSFVAYFLRADQTVDFQTLEVDQGVFVESKQARIPQHQLHELVPIEHSPKTQLGGFTSFTFKVKRFSERPIEVRYDSAGRAAAYTMILPDTRIDRDASRSRTSPAYCFAKLAGVHCRMAKSMIDIFIFGNVSSKHVLQCKKECQVLAVQSCSVPY